MELNIESMGHANDYLGSTNAIKKKWKLGLVMHNTCDGI